MTDTHPDVSTPNGRDAQLAPGEYRVSKTGQASQDEIQSAIRAGQSQRPDVSQEILESELLSDSCRSSFGERWTTVQAGFVDDPRNALSQADALVNEIISSIHETFAERRTKLEQQWETGAEASTEDLRLTMQKYRSFFERLLSL